MGLMEDLRLQLLLQPTSSYEKLLRDIQWKWLKIWDDFYCMDAMIHKDWMRPLYDLRHAVARLATHVFTSKLRHVTNQETNASASGVTGTMPCGVRKDSYPWPNWVLNDCVPKPMHILCFIIIINGIGELWYDIICSQNFVSIW